MQCVYCNRDTEDGVTLVTSPCDVQVCEDCLDAHRGCPACATELAHRRADDEYDRRRVEND